MRIWEGPVSLDKLIRSYGETFGSRSENRLQKTVLNQFFKITEHKTWAGKPGLL